MGARGRAHGGSVKVVAHHVDNHRLALALEEGGELLPIVRKALHEQLAEAAKAREGAGEGEARRGRARRGRASTGSPSRGLTRASGCEALENGGSPDLSITD